MKKNSLAHSHTQALLEKEKVEAKLRHLEAQLSDGIITLLNHHQAFNVPYPLLCGALIDTLLTIDNASQKHETWQHIGQKFLASLQPKKHQRTRSNTSKTNSNNKSSKSKIRHMMDKMDKDDLTRAA